MAVVALDGVVRAGKGTMVHGDNLPRGFLGPVRAWNDLMPTAPRRLVLPRDLAAFRERPPAAQTHDLIEIRAVTESLGPVETLLRQCAAALVDGGTLLADIDNLQSARMLRVVLQGRPGPFDPAGSTADPTQALPLRRMLAAAAAAGLRIADVVAVPSGAAEVPAEFARSLFAHGLLPLDWLDGPPPARFWLRAARLPAIAGSVLLAGDRGARERTIAALREFLPEDWEVLTGDDIGECAQWNRALAAARGEVVWFLRAGAAPTASTFAALAARAAVGAVVPARRGERWLSGDPAGLMLPRLDALFAGPLPESIANTQVALEDYALRLDARLPPAMLLDLPFHCPPAPAPERPETFAAETAELVSRWSPVSACPVGAAAPPAPWADRRPRITLCMIARDEERFLGECLSRARAAVDEIVLVDTGSTDRTVAIASSFGARVLHEPWADDFSAPRNSGLAAATGDWVLVLDADEFLVAGAAGRIRELVENPTVLGYHLRFVNVYGKGRTQGVMMVRLFRNLPGIAYQNCIHEQITPSLQRIGGPLGLTLSSADVDVEHFGYSDEIIDQRGKNERNERLFRKQLAADPDDVYTLYKYGDFLRRLPGRSDDARRLIDRCLQVIVDGPPTLPRELPYAGEVAALAALEAERAGSRARAREIVDLALRRFVPTPNLHYIAANLALADEQPDEAVLHFRRCLTYRGQTLVVPIQDGITGHVSMCGIAQAWLLRGEFERASRLLEQTTAMAPDYEVAHLALSRLWLTRGEPAKALAVLTGHLARCPDSPGACQQLTFILQRLGQTDAARRMGRHAVRLLEARALDHEAVAMNELLAAM